MFRSGPVAALALVTASAMLVGCAPPGDEPATSSSSSPSEVQSDSQALAEAVEVFDRFYAAVDDQFATGEASAQALAEHATPSLAREFAAEIQAFLDGGQVSRGVLVVTNSELVGRTPNGIDLLLCTDASAIETRDAEGNVQPAGALVAWSAHLERSPNGNLRLDELDPTQDQGVCNA
jgi:hypothetical protein